MALQSFLLNIKKKKKRKIFKPINIIYKPTKNIEIEPLCYFSEDVSKAYSSVHSKGSKKGLSRAHKVYQSYYCNKFFINEARQKRHKGNCSEKPGVIYNFNNQCLISYQDNFRNRGDLAFVIYFDFETRALTDNCLDPEQKKMSVVSYVMIVVFHPALKLDRIIIYRSFSHSVAQLTTLEYLTREQITFKELHLINMLKNMAFEVSKRKCKNGLGQFFSIESALVKKTLLKWFNMKFKRQFEKVNPIGKLRYESQNPVNWNTAKCVICKFPMKLKPTNYLMPDNEMTFGDFVIRYEHKFLRNSYTTEQIQQTDHIKNLQSYYEIFEEYIQICIGLLALLNSFNRHNFINHATEEFAEEKFAGGGIRDIKNTINQTEIKNALKNSGSVNKFNLIL